MQEFNSWLLMGRSCAGTLLRYAYMTEMGSADSALVEKHFDPLAVNVVMQDLGCAGAQNAFLHCSCQVAIRRLPVYPAASSFTLWCIKLVLPLTLFPCRCLPLPHMRPSPTLHSSSCRCSSTGPSALPSSQRLQLPSATM